MSYYNVIGLVFNCLSVAIPFYLVFFKQKEMLYWLFVVYLCYASTFSYDFELFGVVNLQQITLVLITLYGMGRINKKDPRQSNIYSLICLYIVYLALITVIGYLVKKDYILIGSIIQNQLRPVVQIVFMFFSYISLAVCTTLDAPTSQKLLIIFYKTTLFMAVLGIAQSLIYSVTAFDILPMRKDFVSETMGLSAVAENGFLRATAGVGEPKQLAKFAAIGLALQLLSHKKLGYSKWKINHILVFCGAIFFTASTTGYILLLAAFGFYCLKNASKHKSFTIIFIIIFIVMAVLILNSEIVVDKFDRAENAGEIAGLENSDSAAVRWLLAEPYFAIFGVGLVNTVAYANKYASSANNFINYYPYTLRRGIVYHLAETGIVGTVIFMRIVSALYKSCKNNTELKYMFIFIIFMHIFLTKEAVESTQLLLMSLLSNCGVYELSDNDLNKSTQTVF